MEAQSHLELSGIVYPPCPKYKQAAALAEQGMQGPGGAMAPGQQMPPGGEPSAGLLHSPPHPLLDMLLCLGILAARSCLADARIWGHWERCPEDVAGHSAGSSH